MTTMPILSTRHVLLRRSRAFHGLRRGNALVLVTAVLVLLVIIATAYISRAQSIRSIASTQRQILGRGETVELSTGVVADAIASDLFPRLVQADDPGINAGQVSTSSTPRPLVDQVRTQVTNFFFGTSAGEDEFNFVDVPITRYMNDPQGEVNVDTGVKFTYAPYNFAPYETKPWTNWPDGGAGWLPLGRGAPNGVLADNAGVLLGDDNPIGNPGFGDSRWLRSSEPQRSYDQLGWIIGEELQDGQPASGIPGFTHWSHLSWIPTANNGWRVCFDISNVAPFDLNEVDIDNVDPDDQNPKFGFTIVDTAAEQLLNGGTNYEDVQFPLALQTPYEQWLAGTAPAPFSDSADFINRRNLWFGSPRRHFAALTNANLAMPNFMRLNDLGPPSETYVAGTDRNVVERTLTDTDGDGWTDSFWYLLPGTTEDGVRQVASVSVVDNASRVDVNVATRFDRWSTTGQTPADVALVGRLVDPSFQLTDFEETASAYDPADTWTGLFADPQNTWPQGTESPWGFVPRYSTKFDYQIRQFDTPAESLGVAYDPYRFGDSTLEPSTWLERIGVTAYDSTNGTSGLSDPYNSLLVAISQIDPERAEFDRRRYFNRRQNTGGLYTIRTDANGNQIEVDDWELGALSPQGFTDADELELRMYESSNFGPVVSSLERAVNRPWDYQSNLLRSTLTRAESVEPHLGRYEGDNPNWPPNFTVAVGDQLTADQLLRDTRHRMTTYSSTRNDVRPLHLRPTSEYNATYDYAFGRTFAVASNGSSWSGGWTADPRRIILGGSGQPEEQRLLKKFSRAAYDARSQKLDLRSPLDAPLSEYESLLYQPGFSGNNRPAFPDNGRFDVARKFAEYGGAGDQVYPGLWPGDPGSGFDDVETADFKLRVELDRAWRFRQELQETIAKSTIDVGLREANSSNPAIVQSYWGSNWAAPGSGSPSSPNTLGRAAEFTGMMAASWAANIDCYRDNRPRPIPVQNFTQFNFPQSQTVTAETVYADGVIYPSRAPGYASNGLPETMRNVVFPGLEAQPVIMEAFFSLVYPPSRLSDELVNALQAPTPIPGGIPGQEAGVQPWYQLYLQQNGDGSYDSIDFDSEEFRYEIPKYFEGYPSKFVDRSSEPAIVFAIQIANPFNAPVPLQDLSIQIGGAPSSAQPFPASQLLQFSQLPSPQIDAANVGGCASRAAPYFSPAELVLGPTLPEAPRTAIVFGIIPPRNVVAGPPTSFQNRFQTAFRIPYAQFHAQCMDFMDIEPGALFGWEQGMTPCELQTLVFDASPVSIYRDRPWAQGGAGEVIETVAPLSVARAVQTGWKNGANDEGWDEEDVSAWFKGGEPDRSWVQSTSAPPPYDPTKGSVRLIRRVYDPLAYDTQAVNLFNQPYQEYEIDRLDNELLLDGEAILGDDLAQIVEENYLPPKPYYSPRQGQGSTRFPGPPFNFTARVDGVVLGQGSFLMTWARAGRPWGWDVNRNGVYDMSEVSPRFVFSDFPASDITQNDEIERYASGQPVGVIVENPEHDGGQTVKAKAVSVEVDPDENQPIGGLGRFGWPRRSYRSPLALASGPVANAGSPYSLDFQVIRGKPTHLTTSTALSPTGLDPDFNAGFPVLPDGRLRTLTNDPLNDWPGKNTSSFRHVLMDKGQDPVPGPGGGSTGIRTVIPVNADQNQNGIDDGVESYGRVWLEKDKWSYPLQMLLKNGDFDQIGELNNVFLFGPAVAPPRSASGRLETVFTLGEIMASEGAPFSGVQVGQSSGVNNIETWTPPVRRTPTRDVYPPTEFSTLGVRTNRFDVDAGNLQAAPGSQFGGALFRPPSQVLEVNLLNEPWTPMLPAGLSIFDAVVCDGPGANYRPDFRESPGESGDTLELLEQVAIDDARFGNAAGFSGDGTRGLININTASVEVLRTLPHMSRLVHNDRLAWPGAVDLSNNSIRPWWYPTSLSLGDVEESGEPRFYGLRNPQWVRVPEAIDRYRDGAGLDESEALRPVRVDQLGVMPFTDGLRLPTYDDRGTFDQDGPAMADWTNDPDSPETRYVDLGLSTDYPGLIPGTRRTKGFASTGELMLLRKFAFTPSGAAASWPTRSVSIEGAGLDPYGYQFDLNLGTTAGANAAPWDPTDFGSSSGGDSALNRLGLGWRPLVESGEVVGPSLQADTRIATDVQGVRFVDPYSSTPGLLSEVPDTVAGDAEERNLLFAGLSNLVSVRSDTFTVHMKVRSFQRNPITGVWDATDPEYVVDEARYVFVVDRSKCDKPSDKPEIRLISRIPR